MERALTRRSLVAAAPAAVVAVTLPALAAGAHSDAELLALREPWLATLDEFNAALTAKGKIDEQVFARSRSYPDFKDWSGSYVDYTETYRQITAEREAIAAELGGDEIDQLEDATCDANDAVIEQIEAIPARTLAGLAFKAEVSEKEAHNRPELIESIMADIEAMAKGGLDA